MSYIDWQIVPENFHYLDCLVLRNRIDELLIAPWVEELGRSAGLAERTAIGLGGATRGLTAEELSDLARVHDEICHREDNMSILMWIDGSAKGPEAGSASWIRRLLVLLEELGEFKTRPFCDHMIISDVECQPTWKNLPQELAYLKEAYEKYYLPLPEGTGPIAKVMHFYRSIRRWRFVEKRKLRHLGERLSVDKEIVNAWYHQFRDTPEGRAVGDLCWILVEYAPPDLLS